MRAGSGDGWARRRTAKTCKPPVDNRNDGGRPLLTPNVDEWRSPGERHDGRRWSGLSGIRCLGSVEGRAPLRARRGAVRARCPMLVRHCQPVGCAGDDGLDQQAGQAGADQLPRHVPRYAASRKVAAQREANSHRGVEVRPRHRAGCQDDRHHRQAGRQRPRGMARFAIRHRGEPLAPSGGSTRKNVPTASDTSRRQEWPGAFTSCRHGASCADRFSAIRVSIQSTPRRHHGAAPQPARGGELDPTAVSGGSERLPTARARELARRSIGRQRCLPSSRSCGPRRPLPDQ